MAGRARRPLHQRLRSAMPELRKWEARNVQMTVLRDKAFVPSLRMLREHPGLLPRAEAQRRLDDADGKETWDDPAFQARAASFGVTLAGGVQRASGAPGGSSGRARPEGGRTPPPATARGARVDSPYGAGPAAGADGVYGLYGTGGEPFMRRGKTDEQRELEEEVLRLFDDQDAFDRFTAVYAGRTNEKLAQVWAMMSPEQRTVYVGDTAPLKGVRGSAWARP